jgi:uncharacterized protein (TIGR01777 family)
MNAGPMSNTAMTILVSGGAGLIGRRLMAHLESLGHEVRGLSRRASAPGFFQWDPQAGKIDPQSLENVDGVIHLAGENIASGRWTASRRRRILESRVLGARCLVKAMRELANPPRILVSASGVNIYQPGPGLRDESSPPGTGFMADVCRRWESEVRQAETFGCRTVCLRTAAVLDPSGGALAKMLPAFRLGLGSRVGPGSQGFPWISMDDLLDIYVRAISDESLSGPVNAVHPHRVTQMEFARSLAMVLGKPCCVPLPSWAVRILLGQLGREVLLADLNVEPAILTRRGHSFRHKALVEALNGMLQRVQSG